MFMIAQLMFKDCTSNGQKAHIKQRRLKHVTSQKSQKSKHRINKNIFTRTRREQKRDVTKQPLVHP